MISAFQCVCLKTLYSSSDCALNTTTDGQWLNWISYLNSQRTAFHVTQPADVCSSVKLYCHTNNKHTYYKIAAPTWRLLTNEAIIVRATSIIQLATWRKLGTVFIIALVVVRFTPFPRPSFETVYINITSTAT